MPSAYRILITCLIGGPWVVVAVIVIGKSLQRGRGRHQ
jgi:hypothetical protein